MLFNILSWHVLSFNVNVMSHISLHTLAPVLAITLSSTLRYVTPAQLTVDRLVGNL